MVTRSQPNAQCAVVSGAAAGIGAATATRLQHDGWSVLGVDIDAPDHDAAAGWVRGDVRDPDTLQSAIDRSRSLGGLGAWINNAAIQQDQARPLHTRSRAEIETSLAINLLAPIHATAIAAGEFIAAGTPGAIVNVSSMHGARPSRGWSMYAAAKAGLEGLTRGAAADFGPFGIRVNAVAPGQVLTDSYMVGYRGTMSAGRAELEDELLRTLHPLGRAVTPEDVADVIAFLISPAATSITATVLPVDGGRQSSDPYDALVDAFAADETEV